MQTKRTLFNEAQTAPANHPLDTTFGQHSSRAEHLRTQNQGGTLEITESALTHLTLSTVSKIARIAEAHPKALRYFPEGSRLLLSAAGESSDYIDPGYLIVYCELRFPVANGTTKCSGKEEIYRSANKASRIEFEFEKFLKNLESDSLDSNGGIL